MTQDNTVKYIKYLILPGVILTLVVFVAVSVSAMGARLVEFEEQKNELENNTRLVNAQLVEHSSLSELEEKASQMGLAKAADVVYLNGGEAVAGLPY